MSCALVIWFMASIVGVNNGCATATGAIGGGAIKAFSLQSVKIMYRKNGQPVPFLFEKKELKGSAGKIIM